MNSSVGWSCSVSSNFAAKLKSPCSPSPRFIVSLPGLKSSKVEFSSCVGSLQCSLSSIQKVKRLFLSTAALPRAYALLNQGPGLLLKRKFSVWNLLSSTYFLKIGLLSTLESCYAKNVAVTVVLGLLPKKNQAFALAVVVVVMLVPLLLRNLSLIKSSSQLLQIPMLPQLFAV